MAPHHNMAPSHTRCTPPDRPLCPFLHRRSHRNHGQHPQDPTHGRLKCSLQHLQGWGHQNTVATLDYRINDVGKWQDKWKNVCLLNQRYDVPSGHVGIFLSQPSQRRSTKYDLGNGTPSRWWFSDGYNAMLMASNWHQKHSHVNWWPTDLLESWSLWQTRMWLLCCRYRIPGVEWWESKCGETSWYTLESCYTRKWCGDIIFVCK